MEPIIHTLKTRCACGAATLETTIDYTYIDGVIEIQRIHNVLNESYSIPVDKSGYIEYRLRFNGALRAHAAREIEHMKKEARRHDEWLREELDVTGAPAHLRSFA